MRYKPIAWKTWFVPQILYMTVYLYIHPKIQKLQISQLKGWNFEQWPQFCNL